MATNNQKTHTTRLRGGLDTSAAPMSVPEGCLIGSSNYQERVVDGGYERVGGYERYDGRPRPSDAAITVLQADPTWHPAASIGAIATGSSSGAAGVICYYSETLLALTKVTGTFVNGEQLLVGATPVGQANMSPSVDPLVLNDMYAGAETIYRADIAAVPGSGPVCGVCVIDDVVYAFRNNVAGTKQEVWRATASGWVAIAYPSVFKLFFTNGNGTFDAGAVIITQGAVTAVAHRVMVNSGDWAAGTAAGMFALRGAPTGGAFTAGAATMTGGVTLTLGAYQSGDLAPGGRWTFVPYQFNERQFTLSAGAVPVYGVDRVLPTGGGNCIEFDGFMAVPLLLGGVDGPYRIACHKQHLFVVQRQTTLRHSGIGTPYNFSVLAGAGEILVSDKIMSLNPLQSSQDDAALAIVCENRTEILYGNDAADWNLVTLSSSIGGRAHSMQFMDNLMGMDQQGIREFLPTQVFGNFTYKTLTNHIRNDVVGKTVIASAIDRDGGRYRVYFSDGTWLSGTPGKRWSWMPCRYPVLMPFVQDWEIAGQATILAGGADGRVYMLDRGRSFDGAPIEAWCKTAYAHFGAPHLRKAFKAARIEIRGQSAGRAIAVMADYSYGDTAISANSPAQVDLNPIPPPATPWDLGTWDTGTWDGQYASLLTVNSRGVGENVALTFYSLSAVEKPHHITTATHFFAPRRMARPG